MSGLLILIVEDDEKGRLAIERVLVGAGHRVCHATNGNAGIVQMRLEMPDLVLLDMLLGPDSIDGWEVSRRKKADPLIAGIPMLLLSGLSSQEIHQRARAGDDPLSNISILIGKPLNTEELLRAVAHIEGLIELEDTTQP